jgi:hypothetical protein
MAFPNHVSAATDMAPPPPPRAFRLLACTVLAAVLLSACNSPKDANDSNFEKAVNAHFARRCITMTPSGFSDLKRQNETYPVIVVPDPRLGDTSLYEILVKAGILSAKDGTTKVKQMFGGEKEFPAKFYDLTDTGKKALVDQNGKNLDLCIGHYKVDKIIRFTEPSSAFGPTVSEVSYTYSPTGVPDWIKSPEVQQSYGLSKALADGQNGRIGLVLASDGWIVSGDLDK